MKNSFKPLGIGWMLSGILFTAVSIVYLLIVHIPTPEEYYNEKYNDARITQSVLVVFAYSLLFIFTPFMFCYLAWYWLAGLFFIWEVVSIFGAVTLKEVALIMVIIAPALLLVVIISGVIAEIIKAKTNPLILEPDKKKKLVYSRILMPLVLVILLAVLFGFIMSLDNKLAILMYDPRTKHLISEIKFN